MRCAKLSLASRVAMEANAANLLPSTLDGLISSMGVYSRAWCSLHTFGLEPSSRSQECNSLRAKASRDSSLTIEARFRDLHY